VQGTGCRLGGAHGYSHGQCSATVQRADAEPVAGLTTTRGRPGGAEEASSFCLTRKIPASGDYFTMRSSMRPEPLAFFVPPADHLNS